MREHTEKLRTGPDKANVAFYAAAILCGVTLGRLVPVIPPMYLLFLTAGLSFAWLLLFKIEVAIILALFLQNILGGFNYLGGGTPFHPQRGHGNRPHSRCHLLL